MNQNMFLSHDRLSFLLNKKPRMDLHSFGNVSIASHMNLGIGIFFYLLALRYQTVSSTVEFAIIVLFRVFTPARNLSLATFVLHQR